MADTGFKTTGTVESTGNWQYLTTTRINTSDNSRALGEGTTYDVGQLSDFNFGIPGGATIDGIEIEAEFKTETAGFPAKLRFSLSWNDGANWTTTKEQQTTSTTDSVKTYGGPTDTWGRTWTASELADGTFRVKIEGYNSGASNRYCGVDLVRIKVYYTEASSLFQKSLIISQAVQRSVAW